MPANYVLLEKITVGTVSASSVTFSSIPQTGYTDLVLVTSTRNNAAWPAGEQRIEFNGSSVNLSAKALYGTGNAGVGSYSATVIPAYANGGTSAANTFGSAVYYIPNYTSSTFKSVSSESVFEDNAAQASQYVMAGLWSSTSAITSITLTTSNNSSGAAASFVQGSTFYLYGVAKLGTTPAIAPKATGGDIVMTDGTYWYHAFRSSGTFTPAKGLSCDVLVVAGGGSGGVRNGGGGGAGGLLAHTAQSLTTATNYTVTIGAGGAGATNSPGANGSNSQFASLTASVGGGGGADYSVESIGRNGGSGGGGYPGSIGTAAGGTATSGQGYNGGSGSTDNATYRSAGGGGGAGAAGANGNASAPAVSGAGGNGVSTYSAWGLATGTGQNISGTVWFAGGGGGANTTNAAGGNGGGTAGAAGNSTSADANTGGGSGGGTTSGNGGSGIVIVRYTV